MTYVKYKSVQLQIRISQAGSYTQSINKHYINTNTR